MTREERVPANVWCGGIVEELRRLRAAVAGAWADPENVRKAELLSNALELLDKATHDLDNAVLLLALADVNVHGGCGARCDEAYVRWWHTRRPGSAVLSLNGPIPLFDDDEIEEDE